MQKTTHVDRLLRARKRAEQKKKAAAEEEESEVPKQQPKKQKQVKGVDDKTTTTDIEFNKTSDEKVVRLRNECERTMRDQLESKELRSGPRIGLPSAYGVIREVCNVKNGKCNLVLKTVSVDIKNAIDIAEGRREVATHVYLNEKIPKYSTKLQDHWRCREDGYERLYTLSERMDQTVREYLIKRHLSQQTLAEVCRAVEALRDVAEMNHGDLHLANMMFTMPAKKGDRPEWKFIDFGSSWKFTDVKSASELGTSAATGALQSIFIARRLLGDLLANGAGELPLSTDPDDEDKRTVRQVLFEHREHFTMWNLAECLEGEQHQVWSFDPETKEETIRDIDITRDFPEIPSEFVAALVRILPPEDKSKSSTAAGGTRKKTAQKAHVLDYATSKKVVKKVSADIVNAAALKAAEPGLVGRVWGMLAALNPF